MAEVTVIIVNWNAKNLLRECLGSIKDSVSSGLSVIDVIDNGSRDGSREMVKSEFPQVNLVESDSNLGFARANNIAIRSADSPFVLLLNSDTLASTQALSTMVRAMRARPEFWICTCQHLDGSGMPSNPFGSFPTLKREFLTLTGLFKWPGIRWLMDARRKRRLKAVANAGPDDGTNAEAMVSVDWVNGACMMIRTDFAQRMGGLDERFFFYGEDIDICWTASKQGGCVGFLPAVSITHFGGGSTRDNYLPLLRQYMLAQTQLFAKHLGLFFAICLRGVYLSAGLLSLGKWSIMLVASPRQRRCAREWLQFWGRVILDGALLSKSQ